MSKKKKDKFKKYGLVIVGVGVGIVIVVIIPIWGFVIAVGGGLIYFGWYLMDHYHN